MSHLRLSCLKLTLLITFFTFTFFSPTQTILAAGSASSNETWTAQNGVFSKHNSSSATDSYASGNPVNVPSGNDANLFYTATKWQIAGSVSGSGTNNYTEAWTATDSIWPKDSGTGCYWTYGFPASNLGISSCPNAFDTVTHWSMSGTLNLASGQQSTYSEDWQAQNGYYTVYVVGGNDNWKTGIPPANSQLTASWGTLFTVTKWRVTGTVTTP